MLYRLDPKPSQPALSPFTPPLKTGCLTSPVPGNYEIVLANVWVVLFLRFYRSSFFTMLY